MRKDEHIKKVREWEESGKNAKALFPVFWTYTID